MFLMQPTMVVVNAELYCVHSTVEYIRMNPMTHDSTNWLAKSMSDHPSNSIAFCMSPVKWASSSVGTIINSAL
uniref:Uncharacterized protein n=1 Tax=Anguilla anguilla TaxID=7936 RepID=A0A0E9XHF2_ANGAN